MKIVPSAPSGGGIVNLSSNSSQNILFQIPAMTVHYINKSFLAYNTFIPGHAVANHFNVHFTDTLSEFNQLTYGDNIQHEFVNLQNVNNYCKGVARVMTPLKNIENNDISDLYSLPDISQDGRRRRLQNYTPVPQTEFLDASIAGAAQNIIDKPDKELSHSLVGLTAQLDTILHKQVKLGDIPNTYFNCDQPIVYPSMTYLKLQSSHVNKIAYRTSDVTTLVNVAAPNINSTTGQLQNLCLWLAVEENEDIIQSVMAKMNTTGIPLNIPYTVVTNQTFSSTSGNFTVQLNRDYGNTLKYIAWFPLQEAEGVNMYDISNYDGSKIVSYNTSINSRPLQNELISCKVAQGLDWLYNKEFVKDACIGSRIGFQMSWCHVDSFVEPEDKNDHKNIKGLAVKGDILLGFNSTLADATARQIYCCPTFMRSYRITPMGIERLA